MNGEPVVDTVDYDVKNIIGIPCGPRRMTGLASDDVKARKAFIQQSIGGLANETNSGMTKKQCDNFKVSFVIFVVGHLLAPTTRNNVGNTSFWDALTVPDEIPQYN